MLVILKNVKTVLSKYFDVDYFLRFLVLLGVLYYSNLFYIAVIDNNGRLYSSFLDQHLNYISWIRNSVLYTSNVIANTVGVKSYVFLPYCLKTSTGSIIEMVYDCLGIGLMSFWTAFVLAGVAGVKKKIIWCIAGLVCIWFINSWRVALIIIALENRWKINATINHHTLFNIVAYTLMAVMIWLYSKNEKKILAKA